jgi:hypothetical protein
MRCTRFAVGLALLLVAVPSATAKSPTWSVTTVNDLVRVPSGQLNRGTPFTSSTTGVISTRRQGDARLTIGTLVCDIGVHKALHTVDVVLSSTGAAVNLVSGENGCAKANGATGPMATATAGAGSISSNDPAFVMIVHHKRATIKVKSGVVVVTGRGGRTKAVVVRRGKKTVVSPHGNPSKPAAAAFDQAENKALNRIAPPLPHVDTTRPRTTMFGHPTRLTTQTQATFSFKSKTPEVTYECMLDTDTIPYVCSSGKTYTVPEGAHKFTLRAVSSTGYAGRRNIWHWTVQIPHPLAQTITVAPKASATVGDPAYAPVASAPGGPVKIVLDTSSSGCDLTKGAVTFTASGSCMIDFDQIGSEKYDPAPRVQQTITVSEPPYLFWTSEPGSAISRARVDGSSVKTFAKVSPFVLGAAAYGNCLYWTDHQGHTISREKLDGTGLNASLVNVPTGAYPTGIAAGGGYIFWANYRADSIGRANLDGTNPQPNLIPNVEGLYGLAVWGNNVYWTNAGDGTIGQANLDGSNVNPTFITGASLPYGLATDGTYLYWANSGAGTIGRATLDGKVVNQSFIPGASQPLGLAVSSDGIFWANYRAGTIGYSNLSGTVVNQSLVPNAGSPYGVAVSSQGPPTGPC